MSLLLDNDVELPSDPPLHPLAPDSGFGGHGLQSLPHRSSKDTRFNPEPPQHPPDKMVGMVQPSFSRPDVDASTQPTASESEVSRSAFRPVGSHIAVNSPAVKPAVIPLLPERSPQVSRRLDSSDQETVSPTPSSTASESQPPTPAVHGPFSWPTHSEENRQLLGGTEEESSDKQSSDEEEKNIWLITREQMSYYMTQFRSMQSNPLGVIPGTQAKEFFEKSRLPIQELRKIWQLSDVTKDGCLSLEEFLTAMHLVVLRRNGIPLPDLLPLCLKPLNLKHKIIQRHNKDLYDGNQRPLLEDTDNTSLNLSEHNDSGKALDTDSAVSPESLLSSPGRPKPVKFDFNAVDATKDPTIACPVPLRLSPDSPLSSEDESPQTIGRQPIPKGKRGVVYEQLWNQEDSLKARNRNTSTSSTSSSTSNQETEGEDMEPLSSSPENKIAGPVSLPYLQPAAESAVRAGGVLSLQKKEGLPPSPPPRPGKTHARSSSLDLAQLNKRTAPQLPFLPPRASPGRRTSDSVEDIEYSARDNKEISANIHKYKESVALLTRTVTELNQEVADIMEERVVLEYQLEQLKSFGNQD